MLYEIHTFLEHISDLMGSNFYLFLILSSVPMFFVTLVIPPKDLKNPESAEMRRLYKYYWFLSLPMSIIFSIGIIGFLETPYVYLELMLVLLNLNVIPLMIVFMLMIGFDRMIRDIKKLNKNKK